MNFWTYVISHADVKNILAEASFLKYFNLLGFYYGEASYLSTTFVTAVETILKDNNRDEEKLGKLSVNFMPSYISTSVVESTGVRKSNAYQRSYSVVPKRAGLI